VTSEHLYRNCGFLDLTQLLVNSLKHDETEERF
jgi:hypothetical protein